MIYRHICHNIFGYFTLKIDREGHKKNRLEWSFWQPFWTGNAFLFKGGLLYGASNQHRPGDVGSTCGPQCGGPPPGVGTWVGVRGRRGGGGGLGQVNINPELGGFRG